MEVSMTTYETGRYDMFKRICRFGEAHRELFSEASDARKTFGLVAKYVNDLDALARARRDAVEHTWRQRAEARQALTARLRVLARVACDESRRVPGADAHFPFPSRRWDAALLQTGKLFVSECANARDMFRRYGMPDTFVADLQTLVDAFEDCTHRGWHRRTTIVVARLGTARALAGGLDAVRSLDVIVGNTLAHEPTLVAVWRDIRRNESRRKTRGTAALTPEGRNSQSSLVA
jgi:RNAse (barnase) inhibitor barstar